jgi:putative phosphoesterase
MKLGFVADAHGNPVGLAACLARLGEEGVERLYFLGDAVGYLPGESEVLAQLRSVSALCIRGNHEAMLIGQLPLPADGEKLYQLEPVRARLHPDDRAWIEQWPCDRTESIDGRSLWLMHGSPSDQLRGYVYPDGNLASFDALPYDLVVLANTHRAFASRRGRTLVLNPGSCGLPRDIGDSPSCAVYDTRSNEALILRLQVEPEAVLSRFSPSSIHPQVAACFYRGAAA